MDKIIKQGLQFDAGFDPKSADKMRKTVEHIIASASNINFDTPENKKSLQALISVFRDMFESVGNKKIDFTKMLNMPGPEMFDAFKNSANEMADVWADVVSRMGTNGLRNVFMKDERSLSDALDRLTKNGKLVENRLKNIRQAFKDVRTTDISKLLSDAMGAETNFRTAETWEERTAAALRYIKVRDKILSVKNSGSFDINDVDRHQIDFFKDITDSEHRLGAYFVRDLKEVVPEMQTSLNNIFNLFKKVEIDVVPKVVKVLDVDDILGGKKSVKVDVTPEVNDDAMDADFKQKLAALHDAYQNAQHRLAKELESDLLSNIPEELQKTLQGKLQSVLGKSVLKDADYDSLWGEFRPYVGTGTGIGDGTGSGDASSSEIEALRQQLEAAEEKAKMYRSAMDSMQEEIDGLRGQLADADVENNQKRIETYNELSDAVSRYIELAKSLVSTENNTKEHQQISADMERFSWNNMPDDEQGYIEAINKQKKNIDKIKKAVKIGASTYTDEDGYEYRVVDDTLAEAESKLRSYIYHYASEFDNIGALVDGAKTKDLKNVITKEVDKFKADETIQRQQEEIAEAANVAAVKEMEQIEEIIKRSAPDEKSDKISDTLEELKFGASRVDRFTKSVRTDMLADDIGIISPHKEIENNAKAIKSYEELCGVVERYNELVKKRWVFTGDKEPTLNEDEENEYADLYGRLKATREGVNINKLTGFDGITDIKKLAQVLGIEIPQAAQQAKQSVAGLNNELQATGDKADNVDGKLGDSVSTGASQTSGATAEEVENLEKVRQKVAEITNEVKEKTQEFLNEQTAVKKASQSEIHALDEVEKKVNAIRVALSNVNTLLNNIKKGKDIGSGLSNININVNHKKDEKKNESISINQDSLKSVLENIVYNVKLASGDSINKPQDDLRTIILKELAKYGTLQQAKDAAKTKVSYNGEDVEFRKIITGYFKETIGKSFDASAYENMWKEAREKFTKFEPYEITRDDAISVLKEKIPDNILEGWFRKGDSNYKTKLEELAMSDDEIRNAALNLMRYNFQDYSGKKIDFSEFLNTEIPVYRGKNSEKYTDGDEFLAMSFDRKVAEKFGKYVLETLIRPIDTLGAYQATGEYETLVKRGALETRPEYAQWHKSMTETTTGVDVDDVKAEQGNARPQAQFALEKTLLSVKSVLEKIATNTASLKGVKLQQAVEANTDANKQVVAAVEGEGKSEKTGPNLNKVAEKYSSDESKVPFQRVETISQKTSKSYRTTKTHKRPIVDEEGNWTGDYDVDLVEVIDDYDKIRKESDKTKKMVERAQKKVDEFVAKFDSKTGGNAKFIDGFDELNGFEVTAENIDIAYNKMIMLQQKYAELEKNFRKGQSSLNPFVNAINKSQNIGSTFGEVEDKFNGLIVRSDELTANFNELKRLSEQIQAFTQKMETDPGSITSADFTEFSKQMGEFTSLKTQVDSMMRSETGKNKKVRTHNAQVEAEVVKELIKLYEQLGRAQATGNEDETSRLRGVISTERGKLSSVDYATEMKFKDAKSKGFETERTQAENSALAEQAVTVKRLNALYQQYGVLVERAAFAEGYLKDELESQKKAKNDEILALSNSLDVITPEMLAGFDASFARGKKIESDKQYGALAKKMDADEETRLKNIAKLEKEIAILRADSDSATNDGVRNALNEEIRLREQLIELQKQDLAMDAQDEAYYRKRLSNDTKLAKSNAAASLKERRRVLNEREKEDEKIWKQQVKDIQREHGVNAADSMYKSANDSVIKTVGTKGVSEDIQAKAKELLEQNKELRKLRNEIAEKGNEAEQKDRDALSEQINKVKKLKTEVDGYLKIHEKYSGDNATQFDDVDTSGFGAVGSDQYWNNITTAIKGVTTGKTTIKGLNADTGELTGTTKIAAHTFEEWSATVDPVTGKLSMLRTGIKKTETFIESVTRKTKEIFSYFSGSSIIFKAVNELKKGVQYVRDIDLALTELKKVTDETEETYDRFLETAAKTGERLGSTISAVTEATATFAKLGYSMEQATEMAEAAIVYKNVGDNIASTEDAADSIISTMKGFKLEATESMRIVDSFNEVGNRFAITSQGIGEALRLSASALSEGGNSLDESIGLITAANEVVNDPSSVGTALKTLTLRLRGAKTELEEMGEDVSDMATTTSALQAKLLALTGGQVDIMLDENTFKNSTQILREMADAWEDMTDIQRASALELMGGKRQANVLSALIQNFDTVEKVIETSADSAGSALKENERYLDSIQGKIDQFTNATQTMWSNLLDADWVKGIVEAGTWLIKLIDGVEILGVKIGGLLPTIILLSAVVAKIKYKLTWSELFTGIGEGITKLNTNLTKLSKRFGIFSTVTTTANAALNNLTVGQFNHAMATAGVDEAHRKAMRSQMGLTGATNAQTIAQGTLTAETLKEAVASGILNSEQAILLANKYGLTLATVELTSATAAQIMTDAGLDRTQKKRIITALGLTMQTKTLTREEFLNILAANGVADANERAGIANLFFKETNEKLGFSFKSLGKSISNFIKKNMALLAIAGAIAIIVGITKAADALIDTSEELKEKLSESQNELEATTSELKDLRSELDEVSKAIQNLQTQGTLSFTDQEELNRLRNQRRELESTIALKSQLETAQQKQVNQDASKAYDSYKTTNFKNGKDKGQYVETGGKVGAGVGGVIGAVALGGTITAGVAAAGAKIGGVVGTALGGPIGTIIGIGLGALAGAIVGGVIGAAGGAVTSEAGKDVEEQLDTMKAERDKLEKARNDAYRAYVADPEDKKLLKKYEKAEEKLTEYDTKMAEHVAEIQQLRSQMDWSTATPSQRKTIEEMDDFIDRYNIIMKSQGAVGNAIERIFDYDRYDGVSERIEELVEKYKETEDETILTQISAEAQKAQKDLADVGLSVQDVVDYYTLEKGLFDTSTIEGVTNQYLKGIKIMQELADNTKPIEIKIDNKIEKFTFDDLFEEDESGRFKAREKEFSEMLKGMDDKAQNTFKKFAEHVRNGELTWTQAMEAMKHSANLAGYEFIGQQIAEANAEIFKGIQDDISGTIDTFKEFSSALEDVASSMDLLYKAETQMNTAGRLSVKTALEIIESTDDWEKVLDITNGTITLQEGATETLIQSKLDLIGANLENERQQLEEQKSTILAQGASNDFATTIEESTNLAIRNMAGSMAYLTTMMEAYTRAANGEKINTEDFIAKAEKAKLEAIDGAKGELDWKKNSAEAIGLETINERLADNAARQKMYNQMKTGSDYKNNYDFDKTPGDKYDEDEDSKTAEKMDAFQKEMDYWENRIGANQAKYEQLQNEIDLLEAKGQKADASFYEEQIKLENERKWLLEQQKNEAKKYLDTIIAAGKEGSEEYWDVANTLND